jgi:hypothetical protein
LASAVNSKCSFLRSWTRLRRFNHGFWRCGWAPRLASALLIVAVVAVAVLSYGIGRISRSKWIPAKTKEVHWIQHATFWSQVVLGLIGLGALLIYHGQLDVMRRQLNEMKGSSGQTDEMICLYGKFRRRMRQFQERRGC